MAAQEVDRQPLRERLQGRAPLHRGLRMLAAREFHVVTSTGRHGSSEPRSTASSIVTRIVFILPTSGLGTALPGVFLVQRQGRGVLAVVRQMPDGLEVLPANCQGVDTRREAQKN